MPTYDYRCTNCGHELERFQKMSEGAIRKCPECSQLKLRRLMGTGAGIIFKGSGFYETDYKRQRPAACSTCKEADTCPAAGDNGGGKPESKPSKNSDQ